MAPRQKGRLGILSQIASSELKSPPPTSQPANHNNSDTIQQQQRQQHPRANTNQSNTNNTSNAGLDSTLTTPANYYNKVETTTPAFNTINLPDPDSPTSTDDQVVTSQPPSLPLPLPLPLPLQQATATATHSTPFADEYNYFNHYPSTSTSSSLPEPSTSASSSNPHQLQHLVLTELDKPRQLLQLDIDTDEALAANINAEQAIRAVMERLANASNRVDELQFLLDEMLTTLAEEPQLRVDAPGTQTPALPWFKHYHGKDLPPNSEGQARDHYLSTIRHIPWTLGERNLLKKEIIEHNQREVATQAQKDGEDFYEKIASIPTSYFIESTEHLDWDKIALVIPRRTAQDCKIQWLQNDHPLINTRRWDKEEMNRLLKLTEAKGERDWVGIAKELGTDRTASECLRQYRRRVGQRAIWTKADDDKLSKAVERYGENWQTVARVVGFNSNQCINRWNKTLRPTIRRGKWEPEEDETLRQAVASVGHVWKFVAARVWGRTDAQCRERWCNILDPNLKDPKKWSVEEEEKLLRLRDQDKKSWAEIAHSFGGSRTDNMCMRQYNGIVRRRRKVDKKNASNSKGKGKEVAADGVEGDGDSDISDLEPEAEDRGDQSQKQSEDGEFDSDPLRVLRHGADVVEGRHATGQSAQAPVVVAAGDANSTNSRQESISIGSTSSIPPPPHPHPPIPPAPPISDPSGGKSSKKRATQEATEDQPAKRRKSRSKKVLAAETVRFAPSSTGGATGGGGDGEARDGESGGSGRESQSQEGGDGDQAVEGVPPAPVVPSVEKGLGETIKAEDDMEEGSSKNMKKKKEKKKSSKRRPSA
ncbi:hypothetical protein T439DRAFT_379072 [Meredithblackwellia eburnea MCA 4105]